MYNTQRRNSCKKMVCPTKGNWKRLKKAGKYLAGVEKVTWVMRSWRHDDKVNANVHVDSNLAKGPERKSTSGRHDDDQRHCGETLVQNASDVCAEHGGNRVLRSRHGCSRGTWNAVDDGRLGRDHPRASLD